jgi:hypothetical protein
VLESGITSERVSGSPRAGGFQESHSEFTVNSPLANLQRSARRCINQASILWILFIYQVHALIGSECCQSRGGIRNTGNCVFRGDLR